MLHLPIDGGGFVSIDILERFLPKLLSNLLILFLLTLSLGVLIIGFELGLKHINVGWIFSSASIKIPYHLIGGKAEAIKLAWMYMSLPVGIFFFDFSKLRVNSKKFFK